MVISKLPSLIADFRSYNVKLRLLHNRAWDRNPFERITMDLRLSQKVFLVTGGSSGIGLSIVQSLTAENAIVCIWTAIHLLRRLETTFRAN